MGECECVGVGEFDDVESFNEFEECGGFFFVVC